MSAKLVIKLRPKLVTHFKAAVVRVLPEMPHIIRKTVFKFAVKIVTDLGHNFIGG